jgi:hypothetical protein
MNGWIDLQLMRPSEPFPPMYWFALKRNQFIRLCLALIFLSMFFYVLLLSVFYSVRPQYHLPATVDEMILIAEQQIPTMEYEAKAINLLNEFKVKAATEPKRRGYVCSTFVKWKVPTKKLLLQNMIATNGFCDWAIVVYNPVNHTVSEIEKQLKFSLGINSSIDNSISHNQYKLDKTDTYKSNIGYTGRFEVIVLDSKEKFYQNCKPICEEYYNRLVPISVRMSDKQNLEESQCDLIEDVKDVLYNKALFSKIAMLMVLLPLTGRYKYVWVLDGDLSFRGMDLSWFRKLHQCALPRPPLVSQPLVFEKTQSYRYLQRPSWQNSSILASSVGFIEIQAPLFDALFFEWFVFAFIVPLLPAMHILGVDWGFDEMFCTAASEFVAKVGGPEYPHTIYERHHVCGAIISNLTIHHRNLGEIGSVIGHEAKMNLNFGLMKILHKFFGSFAYHGLNTHVDPFNPGSTYIQSTELKGKCNIV